MKDHEFQPGNKLWQFRNKHGRNHKYTPENFWKEALKYYKWCEANSLEEEKGYAYMGVVTKETFKKMRAMTIEGFCLYADINKSTFYDYEKNDDFTDVVEAIKTLIYEQKFTGAAADLLNANIIARELGLSEKVEQKGSTKTIVVVSSKEDKEEVDKLIDKFENE